MVTSSDNNVVDNNTRLQKITKVSEQQPLSNEFIHLHNDNSHSDKTPSLSLSSSEQTQQDNINSHITMEQKPRPVTHVRQLFVGNLPFRVRWQDLKDLFRKAGNVQRADVALSFDNRSKGHGTVLFATIQDAQRAIDMLHNYKWQGRVLEVREDRGFIELSSNIQRNNHHQPPIHFLPQLQQQQQQHIIPNTIRIHHQNHPMENNNKNMEIIQGGRQLFVGNLPFHCQWQDVKDLFRNAGNILRADVVQGPDGRSRGFGTVLFATYEDAKKAMAMYDGFEFHGRQLRVHFDKFAPGPPVSHHHHSQQSLTQQQQQQQRFTLPTVPATATSLQPRPNFPPYIPTLSHHHSLQYTHHLHPLPPPLPYPINYPPITAAANVPTATATSFSPPPLPTMPLAEPTTPFVPSTTTTMNNNLTHDTALLQQHLLSLDDNTRARLLQHPFQSPSNTNSPHYLSLGSNSEPQQQQQQQQVYLTHPFTTVEDQQPSFPSFIHNNDTTTNLPMNNSSLLVGSRMNHNMTPMAETMYSSSSNETTPSTDLRSCSSSSNLFTIHHPWAPPPLPSTQPLIPPSQHSYLESTHVDTNDVFFSPPPPKSSSLPMSPDEDHQHLIDAVKIMTLSNGSAGLTTPTTQITTKMASGNNNNNNNSGKDTDDMTTTTAPQTTLTSSSVWEPLSGFKY